MSIVRPHLWFESQAEQAAELYTSVLPNSSITTVRRAPAGVPGVEEGAAFIVELTLDGQPVTFLNAGPQFPPSEYFSFLVECDDQEQVDRYWAALTADGGQPGPCGWLKDRFGVSWQIVPKALDSLVFDEGEAGQRAMQAMLGMGKLDIAELRKAHAGA